MVLTACGSEPVAWGAIARSAGSDAAGADWRITLDDGARASLAPALAVPFTPPAGACPGSLVFARSGGGGEWYAAWWQPRAGGASLLVSRSANDGGSWTPPSTADARDRSGPGCDRPRPAIAADSAGGYVHLAYFLRPSDGAGVWFTHSMDQGKTWHAPVGIFYGDAPARVSVAAEGDTVVVAYEYPMARDPRIGVALSHSAGHIFDARVQASGENEAARDPRVAIHGRTVAVAWRPGALDDTIPRGEIALRVGTLP
ncbi:MAG TPA: sialidase family protein [Gemmatimonadaceae bacterium]